MEICQFTTLEVKPSELSSSQQASVFLTTEKVILYVWPKYLSVNVSLYNGTDLLCFMVSIRLLLGETVSVSVMKIGPIHSLTFQRPGTVCLVASYTRPS